MRKILFFHGFFISGVMLAAAACGGDTSPVDEEELEGPVEDDDTPPAEPEPAMMPVEDPGANDPPFDMTPVEDLPEGAFVCEYSRVPNEKITDFSIWSAGGTTIWGDEMSLTGGEFFYQNDAEGGAPVSVEVDAAAGTAHITGTVTGYAGWGLWFGECTNASRWTGIRFVMGGSLGTSGELEFQVQTNNNYPIDTSNSKGACGGSWEDGCASNRYVFAEFPAEPAPLEVPFASLTGGAPEAIESAQLLGIQWQFNCATGDACEVDVTMDLVEFY
jgi:hypothetical protein